MNGILTLNKPAGWTSRDAVDRVARVIRPIKAGHAGTLDPIATGVLVVCLGQATRLIEFVQQMPKTYRAAFLLGQRSASDDIETAAETLADAPVLSLGDLEEALPRFTGAILQRPPAYSALKVAGRRAYKLARRGTPPELAPRPVEVYSLAVARYEYPRLELDVQCSSGTYIRALGRDLAESLGTAAVMCNLLRSAVGDFRLEDAIDPGDLTEPLVAKRLVAPAAAVVQLPRLLVSEEQVALLRRGQLLANDELTGDAVAAIDDRGDLVAILKPTGDRRWKPSPNFLQSV